MIRLLVVKKQVYSKGIITSKLLFSMKSVAGSYHHGNALIFGNNAGYQCRQIAPAAWIFSLLFALSEWGTQDVDQILVHGDLLFSNVIHDRYQGNQFLWHQISLDLQTISGCYYACSINLI